MQQRAVRTPVVAYLRISKDRFGNELGIDRQREKITELAAWLDVKVIEWYVDNDISAYDVRKVRPDFQRLLVDVAAGRAGTVLTYHNDRLIRQPDELETWIKTAPDTSVYSCISGEYDLSTPDGRALARILGAIAAKDSEHQSRRIKDKKLELAKAGKVIGGGRPFGYHPKGMEIDENEAKWVRDGARMILSGRSLYAVAAKWNEAGVPRPRSKELWRTSDVRKLLTRHRLAGLTEHNGAVVGKALWGKWLDEGETVWGSIISVAESHALRTLLLAPERSQHNGVRNVPTRIGVGLFRCGAEGCGARVRLASSNKEKVYKCKTDQTPGKRENAGQHVSRTADRVDQLIATLIVDHLSRYDEVQAGMRPHDENTVDPNALRSEAARIEADQRGLVDDMLAGLITREQLHVMNRGYMNRLAEIDRALAAMVCTSPVEELAAAPSIAEAWEAAPLDVKRAVVEELMVVTLLPAKKGNEGFRPEFVQVEWVGDNLAA